VTVDVQLMTITALLMTMTALDATGNVRRSLSLLGVRRGGFPAAPCRCRLSRAVPPTRALGMPGGLHLHAPTNLTCRARVAFWEKTEACGGSQAVARKRRDRSRVMSCFLLRPYRTENAKEHDDCGGTRTQNLLLPQS